MVRHLVVWCALALAFLASAAFASAASAERLLTKYQPAMYFASGEAFRPTTIGTFVADSDLERFVPGVGFVIVPPPPTPTTLPSSGAGWRLNQRTCSPAAGAAGAVCYATAWQVHQAAETVYGRVVRTGGRVVLQYWFFYYDDFYPYAPLNPDFIWQAHEGDWEVVNVVLSADEEPLFVGYSQHCMGERRRWAKTSRWRGHHPIVYVALGSHANYFSPGAHQFDQRCIPSQVLAFFAQAGLPLPADHTGAGALAGPPSLGAERIDIERVAKGSPPWMSFPGTWGEFQYFHAPAPIGTVLFGLSPVGPAQHDVWLDPLGTLDSWAPG
jgi:hypothetical protein